jgi:hypothetical protein
VAIQADTNDPRDNISRIGPNKISKSGAAELATEK